MGTKNKNKNDNQGILRWKLDGCSLGIVRHSVNTGCLQFVKYISLHQGILKKNNFFFMILAHYKIQVRGTTNFCFVMYATIHPI